MAYDKRTADFYDLNAEEYAEFSKPPGPLRQLAAFLELLPDAGRLLDLGCGAGWASRYALGQGYRVTAIDPAAGIAEQARTTTGIDVHVGTISDIPDTMQFDGIWASFSLLHVPQDEFEAALAVARDRLAAGGLFYLGLEEGSGSVRDSLGRFYQRYSETQLRSLLDAAGFDIVSFRTSDAQHFDLEPMKIMEVVVVKRA